MRLKFRSRRGSLARFLAQPALSVGEFLFFCLVVLVFWGSAVLLLFTESLQLASAQPLPEDERMMRDFGLLPDTRPEPEPVRLTWDGAPVTVTLDVGAERRLVFPEPFRLGLPPAVSNLFEHEIYDRQLLIRPLRPLDTRAKVQLASGRMILLDIHAVTGAGYSSVPLEVVIAAGGEEATVEAAPPVQVVPASPPGYVDLVRFAAQRLYAPERLMTDRPGLKDTSLDGRPLRLIRGSPVLATPIAGWEEAGLFVTAIRIRNEWDRPVTLDPRMVVGRWRAAAFHHNLLPAASDTALYLVSDVPFDEALGFWREVRTAELDAADVPGNAMQPAGMSGDGR